MAFHGLDLLSKAADMRPVADRAAAAGPDAGPDARSSGMFSKHGPLMAQEFDTIPVATASVDASHSYQGSSSQLQKPSAELHKVMKVLCLSSSSKIEKPSAGLRKVNKVLYQSDRPKRSSDKSAPDGPKRRSAVIAPGGPKPSTAKSTLAPNVFKISNGMKVQAVWPEVTKQGGWHYFNARVSDFKGWGSNMQVHVRWDQPAGFEPMMWLPVAQVRARPRQDTVNTAVASFKSPPDERLGKALKKAWTKEVDSWDGGGCVKIWPS
ncbi:hypothetical protein T484DRAFT_3631062 [Baffinella frigidus]|nr:hypothetical protein T484DRAFT_3631062 [Cryptophyta sp. CCMP2293]